MLSAVPQELTVAVLAYDASANPIYIGRAAPGTATATARWQIVKLTWDGSGNLQAIQYAQGSTAFAFVWDDRASFSYS